jgi:hyperpolarization activated cyclic nucleotide-gated potassium channel 1
MYHRPEKNNRLLYPEQLGMLIWRKIMAFSLVYVALLLPVIITFYPQYETFILIGDILITIIFFVDIVLNFFLVYRDEKHKLIVDHKKIALNYLYGWFFLDFLSFFPFFLIFPKFNSINQWIKMLKLFKTDNIIQFFRTLKSMRYKFLKLRKVTLLGYHASLKTNKEVFYLQIFFNLVGIHFIACLAYFIPSTFSSDHNWIILRELEDKSPFEKYLYSLHWIFETFTTVGYGEMPIE